MPSIKNLFALRFWKLQKLLRFCYFNGCWDIKRYKKISILFNRYLIFVCEIFQSNPPFFFKLMLFHSLELVLFLAKKVLTKGYRLGNVSNQYWLDLILVMTSHCQKDDGISTNLFLKYEGIWISLAWFLQFRMKLIHQAHIKRIWNPL